MISVLLQAAEERVTIEEIVQLICTRAASSTEYSEAEKTIPTQETNSGKKTV
jgi:hypothetical protein